MVWIALDMTWTLIRRTDRDRRGIEDGHIKVGPYSPLDSRIHVSIKRLLNLAVVGYDNAE